MNKQVALHLPFFASQEHNIERCIPKGRNDLKVEAEVSFSLKKNKAIPVSGCGGLQGCKMLRIPH
jgi:hypothetical protein